MPERPDLEYIVPRLSELLVGRQISSVRAPKPVVLRQLVLGTPDELLVGHRVVSVVRHGPFVRVDLDGDLMIAIHPMLAGRFLVVPAQDKASADLAVAWGLDNGLEWRYRDDRQMGKVYIAPVAASSQIPGFTHVGIDVLSPAFSRAAFREIAGKRREQAKVFLLDHGALDHLGNAYGDESLWAARIHPKTRMSELSAEKLDELHDAIVDTLSKAIAEIAGRTPALDEKVRDFLSVRGRKDQPCPRCGTTLRVCGVLGHDAYFCPTCQPDNKGRTFVDWSKLPR